MADIEAVLFDFGGVILSSPFEAFAAYERDLGLPAGFIRGLNATNPDANAWAQMERGAVDFDEFCQLFESEARAAGYEIDARTVIALLRGELRPAMVEAVRRCGERLKTALLTNNFATVQQRDSDVAHVVELFDVVVESSTVGVRKPDPHFYEMSCELLGIEPSAAVFLDDLGVNLKPAKALGMHTIKVVDPDDALAQLEALVGFPLRADAA